MSGPATIWEAVNGPSLVAYLRATQIPLEVCPTSNVCTRQVADLARAGVRASFLDTPAKQSLLEEIDSVAARPGPDVSAETPADLSADVSAGPA